MRKMATIRKIDNIQAIPGADAIDVATVGGWKVVVKKGEFNPGDFAIYCEIDSWIPHNIAPFLTKGREPKEFNGVKGERLRTVKLRGQISQGLLLPLHPYTQQIAREDEMEGMDVSDILTIQKWEMPIPTQLQGEVQGAFPAAIPKTDQERIQNLSKEIKQWCDQGLLFEITEKLEGSSCTFYLDYQGVFHVCSRNLDLKPSETNAFWRVAIKNDVERKMRQAGLLGVAIQGELVGPGVQGNIYNLADTEFYAFDVFSGTSYFAPGVRRAILTQLDIKHVPVICIGKDLGTGDVDYILEWADGKSYISEKPINREGIVFKCETDVNTHFKAVSNAYLMHEK